MSQSSYFLNNGSSLEDCFTNFFDLADLCGIKWRQFSSSKHALDVNDDQILSSYAKCIAANHLAVWRRIKVDNVPDHSAPGQTQANTFVQYKKELWVFWYGEDPVFSELVSPTLSSGDSGNWEIGLSYDCRTLLFKALHNLIEKSLLTKGYIRLGQWFFQIRQQQSWTKQFPKSDKVLDGTQVTFKFNFFLHGDSYVCANVDVRQHSAICQLSKDDVHAAHVLQHGIKVILGPHGLAAQLTGQTFKSSDPRVQKLLSDWKKFYPMPENAANSAAATSNSTSSSTSSSSSSSASSTASNPCGDSKSTAPDNEFLSKVIEVMVEDCKMHYPAAYVYITAADRQAYKLALKHREQPQESQALIQNGVLTEAISEMNRKSDEYLDNDMLSGQPNGQSISRDTFFLKALAHQANNLCDSLSIVRHHLAKEAWSTDMLANLNTHLRVKVDCSCSKCQQMNKKSKVHYGITNSLKMKERNIDREKARFLKISAAFHQRGGSLSPVKSIGNGTGEPVNGHSSTSLSSSSTSSSSTLANSSQSIPPRSPASNDALKSNPSSVPGGPNSVGPQMPAMSYKSPVSVSNSSTSLLTTPGLETSPNEINGEIKENGEPVIGSVSTPQSVNSNQVPGMITIKEEPRSPAPSGQEALGIKIHRAELTNGQHLDVKPPMVFEIKDGQEKIVNKQEFCIKQSFDGNCDLRASALYAFDYEEDFECLTLANNRARRGRDSGLIGEHFSSIVKIDDDEKENGEDGNNNNNNNQAMNDLNSSSVADSGLLTPKTEILQNGLNPNSELNKLLQRPNQESGNMDTTKKLLGGKRLREDSSMEDEIFSRSFHSPEEDPNDAFQQPHTPTKYTTLSMRDDHENSIMSHQLGPAELSIMYPTPPSLEAMVQSPCSTFIPLQESNRSENDYSVDRKFNLPDEYKDVFFVYKPPVQTSYTTSDKYAPIKDLAPPPLPDTLTYKVSVKKEKKSGVTSLSSMTSANPSPLSVPFHQITNSPSALNNPNSIRPKNVYHHVKSSMGPGLPAPLIRGPRPQGIGESFSPLMNPMGQRIPRPPMQSPMYNGIGGFANSPALSVDPSMSPMPHNNFLSSPVPRSPFPFQGSQSSMNSPGANFAPIAPNFGSNMYPGNSMQRNMNGGMNMYGGSMSGIEKSGPFDSNSLLLNVLLSDSMFNLFRDHNFESCSLCVCNMNTKGNDVGIYLPDLPNHAGNSDDFESTDYPCNCGFSAVVNRHLSQFSGMFYEDEVDITGKYYDPTESEEQDFEGNEMFDETLRSALCGNLDESMVDLLLSLSTTIFPTTSSFYKIIQSNFSRKPKQFNLSRLDSYKLQDRNNQKLMYEDYSNLISLALVTIQEFKNKANLMLVSHMRGQQTKKSLLHDWPFRWSRSPVNNHEVIFTLKSIEPLIGEAISRKSSGDAVTYNTVRGPLTWRQFHRMAGRGTECQGEPQPIPQLLVGYDKENAIVSPFALKFWEKSAFEPYAVHRDVAYVALVPNNIYLISETKKFFKQLSATYEVLRFGQHIPLKRIAKNGIVVLDLEAAGGKKTAENVKDEKDVKDKVKMEEKDKDEEWMEYFGDSPLAKQIRVYAQAMNGFVKTISAYDGKLFKAPSKSHPPNSNSGSNSGTTNNSSGEQTTNGPANSSSLSSHNNSSSSFQSNNLNSQFVNSNYSSGNGQRMNSFNSSMEHFGSSQQNQQQNQQDSKPQGDQAEQHHHDMSNVCTLNQALQVYQDEEDIHKLPSIVLYVIDPFAVHGEELARLGALGLMKAFVKMRQQLPEHVQNLVHLQLISPDALGCNDVKKIVRQGEFKDICFSTFSLCKQQFLLQSNVKSLTGLGPASAFKDYLKKEDGVLRRMQVFTNPYILAPQLKGKNTDLNDIGDAKDKNQVLYCAYCLSEDQKWLFVSCTNDKGDVLQTKMINIHVPNRLRRRNATVRRYGLNKMMHFLKTVMAENVCGWRLIIGRLGRIGHGELKDWTYLLSKKSLLKYSRQLRELCGQCHKLAANDQPGIYSACLISFEADTSLRVFPNYFTPDERFSSTCNTCSLSTPEDASCTHILVFPTSASAQSSLGNFSIDHTNDGDLFNITENPDGEDWDNFDLFGIGGGLDGVDGADINSPGGAQQSFGAPDVKDSNNIDEPEESAQLSQQPLALAFYVSTAPTGPLPKWFWSKGGHLEKTCPAFLKSALLIHTPYVQQSSDELLSQSSDRQGGHSLDSPLTTDVLRFVLEGYNALSWLSLDPSTFDRISCLPIHIQVLMQLYHSVHALT